MSVSSKTISCDVFAAKRHVVRRGLAELEQMGIVERVPNRGAMVRAYRGDEIQQLYVLRNLLEGHAARLIPMPLSEADIEDLKKVQDLSTMRPSRAAILAWSFTQMSTSTSCFFPRQEIRTSRTQFVSSHCAPTAYAFIA